MGKFMAVDSIRRLGEVFWFEEERCDPIETTEVRYRYRFDRRERDSSADDWSEWERDVLSPCAGIGEAMMIAPELPGLHPPTASELAQGQSWEYEIANFRVEQQTVQTRVTRDDWSGVNLPEE